MSEPSPAARLKVNTTSSAVNGVPSWNCTPLRSSKRQTVGVVCFHLVASAGAKLSVLVAPDQRLVDVAVKLSCSDSFSECGIHR